MYQKSSVGLEEAQGAIEAMITELRSHPEKYWQYACLAVVDERGKLVAYAKMDGPSGLPQDIAIKKAWTAASWGGHIHDINEIMKTRQPLGWGIQDFLPGACAIVGGVAIYDPDEEKVPPVLRHCIGGIGVAAAGPYTSDLEIANVGLKYIQDKLWPKK